LPGRITSSITSDVLTITFGQTASVEIAIPDLSQKKAE